MTSAVIIAVISICVFWALSQALKRARKELAEKRHERDEFANLSEIRKKQIDGRDEIIKRLNESRHIEQNSLLVIEFTMRAAVAYQGSMDVYVRWLYCRSCEQLCTTPIMDQGGRACCTQCGSNRVILWECDREDEE